MAYLQNNVNMPFLSGDKVWQTIPTQNGIEEISYKAFNQDAPFARKNYKTDAQNKVNPLNIYHTDNGGKYLNESAFALFYNRMLASKTVYDFGIITSGKAEKFNVFNGYPNPVNLTSITLVDLSGVEVTALDGTFPITIPPYRSVDLRLHISPQGLARLNGKFILNFSNGDKLTLSVKGSRLVLWNIRPNWTRSVKEQFEYKTDILTSYNKKEQRRGFLVQPRRRVSYTANPSQAVLMALRNILHGWQDKAFMLPLWWQPAKLSNPTVTGAYSLSVQDIDKYDFVQGGSLVVWINEFSNEVFEIERINGNEIILGSPISRVNDLNARIYPVIQVRMNEEMALKALTSTTGELDIEASAVMQSLKVKMPENYTADASYKGVEVLERKPNWANELSETYAATVGEVDFGYGVRQYYARNIPSLVTKELHFVANGYEDILWWKAFIHRQKGALKSFLVPTHTFDAKMLYDAPISSRSLIFRDDYLSTIVRESQERKYLRVKTDKKVYYFTINSVKDSNQNVSITLEETLGEEIRAADVRQISFMQRMRFASDSVEIEYLTRNAAQLSLTLQQIREV